MTTIAIEIADTGLNAADDSGAIGSSSPGYALFQRGDVLVGEPARAVSRLKPRFVSHRHWDHLDQEPVGRPFPRGVTHADLVYAHLSDYWGSLRQSLRLSLPQTSVLLAIPARYSVDHLSLLLGIARAGDIPLTGMVDASVAALNGMNGATTTLHLDIHLHRAVWTVVSGGDRLLRKGAESVEGGGLLAFQDAWVKLLVERFVRETRFDPLHGGNTEQVLYDRLPAWAQRIDQEDSAVLTLDAKGRQHSVEISAGQLVSAASTPLEAILQTARRLLEIGGPATLALSSRAQGIPGLFSGLAELSGTEPCMLPEGAAANGALAHRDAVEAPGRELPLVLGLAAAVESHG